MKKRSALTGIELPFDRLRAIYPLRRVVRKRTAEAFTLLELLVVIGIMALFAGLLLPVLMRAREEARRKNCQSNLSQIVKGCIAYQEPNTEYFPAFLQQSSLSPNGYPIYPLNLPAGGNQGADGTFQPMPSLAALYPAYCTDVRVFACPSTNDKPQIAIQSYNGALHACFGFALYNPTGFFVNALDPAWYSGTEVTITTGKVSSTSLNKCSYFYDELSNPRDIGPDQAMGADADGQTWQKAASQPTIYPSNWKRRPLRPNHDSGQNVMYHDGHVKWTDQVYCSADPNDNIFSPQIGWGADTDAYLWDGNKSDARPPQ